ncbi:flavodoxin family protein [Clostridium sp. PL3]|uniref:Flavodoxin family protein n=1 Tax=Clostridium thailandense TaxID=2794346 RepID=A0A949TU76_9CLOT|nr:flavodoxin family protein [Clostridium thailandense]MBV7271465.1 flavodoxin family protein [Clostridium thailandense]
MSKVVIFNGSPRKSGYTTKLLEQVAKGAKSKGAEIIEFDLNDSRIRGCQGCFYCRTHDGCAVKDYLQPMYEAITEADAIVFGSPNYGYQITGQAKIWLDRTFPMVGENFMPRHPGKKVVSIFVQGSPNPEMGAEGIKAVNNIFARYGWELEDSILCCGTTDFHSEKLERFNSNIEQFEELSLRALKDGENLVR